MKTQFYTKQTLLVLMALMALFTNSMAQNLIKNPGFETLNEDGTPSDWILDEYGVQAITTEKPYEGSNSFEMGDGGYIYQDVEVEGGATYRFRYNYKHITETASDWDGAFHMFQTSDPYGRTINNGIPEPVEDASQDEKDIYELLMDLPSGIKGMTTLPLWCGFGFTIDEMSGKMIAADVKYAREMIFKVSPAMHTLKVEFLTLGCKVKYDNIWLEKVKDGPELPLIINGDFEEGEAWWQDDSREAFGNVRQTDGDDNMTLYLNASDASVAKANTLGAYYLANIKVGNAYTLSFDYQYKDRKPEPENTGLHYRLEWRDKDGNKVNARSEDEAVMHLTDPATFNAVDAWEQFATGNQFVAPAGATQLCVRFYVNYLEVDNKGNANIDNVVLTDKGVAQAVNPNANKSNFNVYKQGNSLKVSAEPGQTITVYTIMGTMLRQQQANGNEITISGLPQNQVLLICNGAETTKVIL